MRRKRPFRVDKKRSAGDIVKDLRRGSPLSIDYRTQSLRIHGFICAKCGREFELKDQHLLTVHHRDGDHTNNPPDGSNWENLCIYCHDDEHSRNVLGDYLSSDEKE
jgi:5-methylcytosine-specific restriction endonuclease McrA